MIFPLSLDAFTAEASLLHRTIFLAHTAKRQSNKWVGMSEIGVGSNSVPTRLGG